MLIALAPLVVLIAGLVLYLIPGNAKRERIGEILFFVGLLVLVWLLGAKTIHIG